MKRRELEYARMVAIERANGALVDRVAAIEDGPAAVTAARCAAAPPRGAPFMVYLGFFFMVFCIWVFSRECRAAVRSLGRA